MADSKKEKKFKLNITAIIIMLICIAAIIPIMHLALYSRPCIDDFDYSSKTHKLIEEKGVNPISLIKEAVIVDIEYYNKWQGLYSSAFILSLQPGIFGEQYYYLGSWLLIACMFGFLFFFCKTVQENILKIKNNTTLLTSVLFTTILAGLPSLNEGIYWFNGAWNYTFFFFLTLFNIACLIKALYQNKKGYLITSIIISFIISGGNHVTAFFNILILTVYCIATFKKSKGGIISLISAIVGFIIMYMAPGTSLRQNRLEKQGTIDTIIMSLKEYWKFIQNTFNNQWILVIAVSLLFAILYERLSTIKKENLRWNPILLYIIKSIIICGMLCVPYKAMGTFGGDRVYNVIWLAFLILSFTVYVYSILWVSSRIKKEVNIKFDARYLKSVLLIIAVLWIVLYNNNNIKKTNMYISNGTAKTFAISCDERFKKVKDSKEDIVYVDELKETQVFEYDDITDDPDYWRNEAWKNYYGKVIIINNQQNY